ncbi:hypothetical protein GMA8713_04575 [Grimontia marina]|uniref:Uncharacterized protein n=1 Tax=Grimontia marina TaxID=646534 RepID=A0A128FJR6_9GAMM|nr:hypothetical protein GMA8713_04575 [Grimontia marina]
MVHALRFVKETNQIKIITVSNTRMMSVDLHIDGGRINFLSSYKEIYPYMVSS